MSEMKDSGIEWIGEIPNNWHTSKIDSLYALRNTKVSDYEYLPLSVTMNGIVPQLENAAKTNAHDDRKLVKAGDFAINSRSDRRGSCGISELDGSVSLINTVLRPLNNMSPRYYNWLFHTSSFADEFYKWGHGIVDDLWTTNWQDMRKISVPVPSISEQNRIASFLDTKCAEIDALSADIQKEIETLQEYRKSVITEAVTKGLDPNAEMKESGIEWIGDIPRHWTTIKLKNTHDGMNVGESIDKEYWEESDGDIVFYTAGLNPITTTYRHFPPEKYTRDNDLLLARNGTPYVYLPIENSVYTDHIIRVKIKDGYSKKYIMYCLQRSINAEIVDTVSIATWSSSIWNRQCFPLPSYEEQIVIASYLDSKCSEIDSLISDKQKQLETLAEYRKSLIYEYVTGKKEVPTT